MAEQESTDQVRLTLSKDEMNATKLDALQGRPFAERVSLPLALHLQHLYENRGDYYAVLDELDFLERYGEESGNPRVSRTKSATKFKKPPLDRFWHKHFFAPRHLIHNIGDAWGLNRRGSGNQKLDAMIQDVARNVGDDPDLWPTHLAHQLIDTGLASRAERKPQQREAALTGDWIIFGEHRGENYYLALASHDEGKDPKRLYALLVQNCWTEFPFLFRSQEVP